MMKFQNDKNNDFSEEKEVVNRIEGQRKDISAVLDMYKEEGYSYSDIHIDFLEKYYGDNIQYIHPYWKANMQIKVNPVETQRHHVDMEVVEIYNRFFNEKLVLVAEIPLEHMDIFLSDKGTFYGCFDDIAIEYGDDFEQTIYMLKIGKKEIYHNIPWD